MSLLGVDVSGVQGAVDWQSVGDAGFAFAIAKACQGIGGVDGRFAYNAAQMRGRTVALPDAETGKIERFPMLVAFYCWLTSEDPIKQAEAWARRLGKLAVRDAVAIDFEAPHLAQLGDGRRVVDHFKRCYRRFAELTGKRPLHYTGGWFWRQVCGDIDDEEVAAMPYWHSEYPSLGNTDQQYREAMIAISRSSPKYRAKPYFLRDVAPHLWQFDGNGGLRLPNGVDVDVNEFRGGYGELVRAWESLDASRPVPERLPWVPEGPANPLGRADRAEAAAAAQEGPPTDPETPRSKSSSQAMRAVKVPGEEPS